MDQRKNTRRPGAWFQSHSYIGAWQGKKASSGRLGDGTEPMQLSSSAQGMSSGMGWGLGPASILPSSRMLEGRAGNGCKGEGMFLPTTFVEDGSPFPAGSGQGPSRQSNITHQSSHPLTLHLQALLPHLPPLPLLRSHWGHQLLPGIWDRNR